MSSGIKKAENVRSALLLTLCFLLFLFVMRAKTDLYHSDTQVKTSPSTASKLLSSSQKMEIRSADAGSAVLFWAAIVSLFGLYVRQERELCTALLPAVPEFLPFSNYGISCVLLL